MTKVLTVGDTHANPQFFERACRVAKREGCEYLLQVGDFGWYPYEDWGRNFIAIAKYELASRDLLAVWIAGNHDDHANLAEQDVDEDGFIRASPHLANAPRGQRWTWAGTRFLACGGAYSVDRRRGPAGVSWWPEETITEEDVERCIEGGETDVFVTHDCPWGVNLPCLAFKDHIPESQVNREKLQRIVEATRPKLVIHGHYHSCYTSSATLGDGSVVRVQGLAADRDGDDRSWLMLDLGDD